ncbi:MAG: alkyl hydroperoxide reductase/Thiol specific antioxidant/Mal allergen [Deltaproteobacteria bacterium]|nr:alkyl hydroperoxide reductase/Thiol specific antioxidant/Mal allergen [Deltaproteobacteria bacterium]
MSRRLALGLAAAVAAVVLAALLVSEPSPDPIRAGEPAPVFALPLLDGGTVELASLRGRIVLLNFWATWCKPCENEMPAMQRLHTALAGPDFELVAVSVDASRDDVVKFRDRLGLTFPIARDPDKGVAEAYQSYRYPESYLIGRDGTILSRYIGPRDWDADLYVDRIRRVLEGAGAGAAPK